MYAALPEHARRGSLASARAWDEHESPALLEVAGRNTAENASRREPKVPPSSSPAAAAEARSGPRSSGP
jgi:hypothetical protein